MWQSEQASRDLDGFVTCTHRDDVALRPHCQHRAVVAYGHIALCGDCDLRRSTVGKAIVGRSLVHRRDWKPLIAVEAAADRLRAAEEELAASVGAARCLGYPWSDLGRAIGVSRQAAQQRFGGAARGQEGTR